MNSIALSIVIVSYNTRDMLAACLASLDASEIVVIDNASTDESVRMMQKEYPHVRVIQNSENTGFARANNQGIGACRGEYILLLNPDTVVQPGALRRMIEFMNTCPQAGVVGPQLLNADGTLQPSGRNFPSLVSAIAELLPVPERWRVRLRGGLNRDYNLVVQVDEVSGAAMCVRRTVFDQIGLLDADFFFLGEDIDLCWRCRKAGWQVYYLPAARVVHHSGGSRNQADAWRISLFAQRGYYRLFQKHRADSEKAILKTVLLLLTVLKLIKWLIAPRLWHRVREVWRTTCAEFVWLLRN